MPLKETFEVTNELINGKTIMELHDIIHCEFVVSRLLNAYNEVIIPTSKTVIHTGDKLLIIMSAADEPSFRALVGRVIDMNLEESTGKEVVSRRIVLTPEQI